MRSDARPGCREHAAPLVGSSQSQMGTTPRRRHLPALSLLGLGDGDTHHENTNQAKQGEKEEQAGASTRGLGT